MENQFLLRFITPISLAVVAVIVYLIRTVNVLKDTLNYQQHNFNDQTSAIYRELQNIREHSYTDRKEFMDEVRSQIESSNQSIFNELHIIRRDNEGAVANTMHSCEARVQEVRDEVERNANLMQESIEMQFDEIQSELEEINESMNITFQNLSKSKESEMKNSKNALLCD